MIHYHGTPITPGSVLSQLAGRSFCVSFADPRDVEVCHKIGQSVMLDNGAFSLWRAGRSTDWPGYYAWAEPWLDHQTTWAVIPDVIDGSEEENDALIRAWPFAEKGAPVWHLHEPIDRLVRLCGEWPRVCIGSSGAYATVGDDRWHRRMEAAMNAVCGNGPAPTWLHMLRGMALAGSHYPFASVDSTDVARNHNRESNPCPLEMAIRWDAKQCPARWVYREQLELVAWPSGTSMALTKSPIPLDIANTPWHNDVYDHHRAANPDRSRRGRLQRLPQRALRADVGRGQRARERSASSHSARPLRALPRRRVRPNRWHLMERKQLHQAERDYERSAKRTEELREKRNAVVRQAAAEGWSHARIAEATGLTRSRVGQIALPEDDDR